MQTGSSTTIGSGKTHISVVLDAVSCIVGVIENIVRPNNKEDIINTFMVSILL
jgi:hypothetical protein